MHHLTIMTPEDCCRDKPYSFIAYTKWFICSQPSLHPQKDYMPPALYVPQVADAVDKGGQCVCQAVRSSVAQLPGASKMHG